VTFADHAAWLSALESDIGLLRAEKVRPMALVLRLEEFAAGSFKEGVWKEFRTPGRGISGHLSVKTHHTVVLEFTHKKDSPAVAKALRALTFAAITRITPHGHDHNDGASIYIDVARFEPGTTGA